MNEFNVVTVPSFSDFVDETILLRDNTTPAARIVLGEKIQQRNGIPSTQVTLDLQGFNARGELAWLSKSLTIVGFRRNGKFDDPDGQDRYEAMEALKSIVEEQLKTLGFRVRAGRYVLPYNLQPINGVFDCAEWYKDEDDHIRVRPASDWGK